jgi:LTXXQ motif family protein
MRSTQLRQATALAMVLSALMAATFLTPASAQLNKKPGPAAPAVHVAPPAPHISAPAPAVHMAAPVQHFTAPAQHFVAPAQHFAAPAHVSAPTHIAAPVHVTPHIATQQIAHPNFAHTNVAHGNANVIHGNAANTVVKQQQIQAHAHNVGPNNLGNNVGAHGLAHRGVNNPNANNAARTIIGPNRTVNGPNNPNSAASKLAGPTKTTPGTATPNVLGQGPGNRGRENQAQIKAQQQAQARTQIYAGHGRPVLHNQVFANPAVRDPALRAMAHATFQGGFARFHDHDRGGRFADRRGFHGVVIGWGGPVFWPYAYADLVDYTFWPSANDTFWPYAYDDVYDGIFGAYAPDATAYANVPSASRRPLPRGAITGSVATGTAAGGMAQICSGQASGLTDWPIERIAQQVQPTAEQRSLLDELKDATAQAVNLMQSSCPTDLPSTPTGRLAAMRQRIEPMLQAVQMVRPALEQFYGSLSDEQKERFNRLPPRQA